MDKLGKLMIMMTDYYQNDPDQVNHFMKVFGYATAIADGEEINNQKKEVLLVSAILHDIGCKMAIEKYGSSAGHYQEIEGPALAEEMMKELNYDINIIERVSFLVGHHHSYDAIDDIDFQILAEADFLVNIDESEKYYLSKNEIFKNIFKTESGIRLFKNLFD